MKLTLTVLPGFLSLVRPLVALRLALPLVGVAPGLFHEWSFIDIVHCFLSCFLCCYLCFLRLDIDEVEESGDETQRCECQHEGWSGAAGEVGDEACSHQATSSGGEGEEANEKGVEHDAYCMKGEQKSRAELCFPALVVLLLSIVVVPVLMTLDRGRHLPTNGLTHELISIGGALVAHDVSILHPIYGMSSRVLLDSHSPHRLAFPAILTKVSLAALLECLLPESPRI